MDFARLKIEADSSQVTTADKALASLGSTSDQLMGKLKQLAGVIGSSLVLRALINDARQFEAQLGGVAKTTGLAGRDLLQFAQNIDNLSRKIPVSTSELLTLAQAAGQMGVTGAANLEKFALTVAKLGTASDLSGDQAATALARILNVTGEAIESVDVLASVIVSLGNNVAATESEIARITTEVARATSAFGVSSAEAAAMGAAMVSIGIRAELGGSSVGRAMQEITSRVQAGGAELKDFADTLQLNSDTLAELFAEDKTAAFQYFLEQVGELGLDAGNALEDVNLGGQEIAKTIIPLSNNMEIFAKTLGLANAEVENATALNNEFEAVLGSFNNQLSQAQNIVGSYGRALMSDVMPGMTELLAAFNDFSEDADNFNSVVDGLRVGIEAVAVVIGAKLVGATWSAVQATTAEIAVTLRATQTKNAYGQVLARTSTIQNAAAVSTRALNGAMTLLGGPAGVLAIVTYGMYQLISGTETLTEKTSRLREEMDAFNREEMEHAIRLQEALIRGIEFEIKKQEARGTAYKAGADNLARLQEELEKAQKGLQQMNMQMDEVSEREFQAMIDEMTEGTEWYTRALEANSKKLKENTEQTDNNGRAKEYQLTTTEQLLVAMGQELTMLQMTGREQAIYQALVQAGIEATEDQREAVVEMAEALYEKREAMDRAAEAERQAARDLEEFRREQEKIAEEMIEEWRNFRTAFGETFADMVEDGDSAMEALLGSWKRMLTEMMGQMALSGILKVFGIDVPGGSASGIRGVLESSGIPGMITQAGLTKFAPGLAASLGLGSAATSGAALTGGGSLLGLAPGLQGAAGWSVASAGTGTAAAGGMGVTGALGAIPGWGWALMGAVALNEMFGHKKTPSFNAGMLLERAPGAKSDQMFDVNPFASGFDPVGFARRSDRSEATRVIDTFRLLDESIVEAAEKLNITVQASRSTFRGLDERGQGSGLFFGAAGEKGKPGMTLEQQLNMYAKQLISTMTGQLAEEDLNRVLQAGGVEEMLKALEELSQAEEEVAKEAEKLTKETEKAAREIEDKFLVALKGVQSVVDPVTNSMKQLADAIQNDIQKALGNSISGGSLLDEVGRLAEARRKALDHYDEQMRAEEELAKLRKRLVEEVGDFSLSMQLGNTSRIPNSQKLELARDEFQSTLEAVLNGDVNAWGDLKGISKIFAELSQDQFASSPDHLNNMKEIMDGLDLAKESIAGMEFDPQAAQDQLVSELQMINLQLTELPTNMADQLASVMSNFIMQALALGKTPEQAANIVKGLGDTAVAATDKALPGFIDTNATSNETITDAVDRIKATSGSQAEALARIRDAAIAKGISSNLLAKELGLSSEQLKKNLAMLGMPGGFEKGGISTGPQSGHLEMLHGTEAVVPLGGGRSIPVTLGGGITEGLDRISREMEMLRRDTRAGITQSYRQMEDLKTIESNSLSELSKSRRPDGFIG